MVRKNIQYTKMKHLKPFLESTQYQNSKLTENDFYDQCGDGLELIDHENFTKFEIDRITKEMKQSNPEITVTVAPFGKHPLLIQLNCEYVKRETWFVKSYPNHEDGFTIEIHKDSDDWHWIKMEKHQIVKTKRFLRPIFNSKETFYKADQLDGLIKLLKEII